jgi:CubicO group peptidase (beta-lactamase class C family)
MNKLFLLLKSLLLIFVGNSLQAQNNSIINLDIENKVNNWLSEYHVPAVGLGIIENSEIKYAKVFGELEKDVIAPDNTIFNIASMTKPVVTMLVLKLVEAGQWNLDEPLFHYWVDPDVANDPFHKKLTTRHVLTHQTGFKNWRWQDPGNKLTFEFEPGTNYQYSGEGFEYLRNALERKFNKPIEKLLDSIIFNPLGMKDTRYWDNDLDTARFALWHDANGNKYKESHNTPVGAADDLLTTIEDYCKFGIDVINGAGLCENLYNDMITPQVKMKDHYAKGLGWEVIIDLPNGEYALEHGGSDQGVKTIAVLLPKSKRGLVILTNGDNGMFVYNNIIKESIDMGEKILEYMKGSVAHKAIVLGDEILNRYVGTYLDSYGRELSISKEDSALKISGEGVPTVKLYPEAENKFFIKDFDVQFEFTEDNSLIITANGKTEVPAKKINREK